MTTPPLSRGAQRLGELLTPVLTQARLAEQLGVTQQAISSWIHGRTIPTPRRLADLERLLGIPMRAWTEALGESQVVPPTSEPEGPRASTQPPPAAE